MLHNPVNILPGGLVVYFYLCPLNAPLSETGNRKQEARVCLSALERRSLAVREQLVGGVAPCLNFD